MKQLASTIVILHGVIFILWIGNSSYLFSKTGILVWIVLLVLGIILYNKTKQSRLINSLIMWSSALMVFLVFATIAIHLITSSMP